MTYKHGVYGEQVPFAGALAVNAVGTIPAYIGTAPIHLVNTGGSAEFDYAPYINRPILIRSYSEAVSKLGYCEDWADFTLCEAVSAHFLNGVKPIGPILAVNMANPADLEAADTTESVTVSGAAGAKIGYLDDSRAAIANIAVTGTPSLTSADYRLEYAGPKIKITVTKSGWTGTAVTMTYKRIDTSATAITAADFEAAVAALDISEASTGVIPNLIAAPGYSDQPSYHEKMIAKAASGIASKWEAICLSDLQGATVAEAKTWKTTNSYSSVLDKVFFPAVRYGGKKYHLSVMAAVAMQLRDTAEDGVPFVSPSNKVIFADESVLGTGAAIYIDEPAANGLNEEGITTTNIVRGQLRLWGGHMANYSFVSEASISPEDRQDASVRMMRYLLNTLQYRYIDTVDQPISRRDIDSIKVDVQQWLNSLVNEGKLLYAAIQFAEADNSTAAMVNGDFVFDVATTTTPNAKSITFQLQYSADGIAALTEGGNE